MKCGSRHGRIPTINGYNYATASSEDIEMAIKDWNDDWRILVLNQEIPIDKEVEVGHE
jgi:hypothetical protein